MESSPFFGCECAAADQIFKLARLNGGSVEVANVVMGLVGSFSFGLSYLPLYVQRVPSPRARAGLSGNAHVCVAGSRPVAWAVA